MNLIRSSGRRSPRRLRTRPRVSLPVLSVGALGRFCLGLLLFSGLGTRDSGLLAAQQQPTNVGPIRTTTVDGVGAPGTPALPPPNQCRGYFNSQTGAYSWVNSNGSSCGPDVTGSCPNCILESGGNAAISGTFGANTLQTTGPTPWLIVGACGSFSAPPGGFGEVGLGPNCVPLIYPLNLAVQVPVAYQDGSGNVAQNANTASALAATPTPCTGQYAIGISANGNALCNTSTIVLIPQQSCSGLAGVPGSAAVCYDNSGALESNLNNGGWGASFLGYSNLIQTGADTLEQRDGTTAQTFNFYSVWSAAGANYQRLQFGFDATNNAFQIASQALGSPGTPCSGGACSLEFSIGSSPRWMIDSSNRLKPFADNAYDIGVSASLRPRDVEAARAFRTGTSSNTDSAGQIVLASATSNSYTFANTGYASAPICTLTPTGDPTSVGVWWVTVTTTTLTAHVESSGSITFDYTCFGRN